jgi:hypothetical protein
VSETSAIIASENIFFTAKAPEGCEIGTLISLTDTPMLKS